MRITSAAVDAREAVSRFPELERKRYREIGATIVEVGDVDYFRRRDFDPDSFLAIIAKRCEISVIHAKHPGRGAFGRLAEALIGRGYRVAVAMPMPWFEDHLLRQGWTPGLSPRLVQTLEKGP